MIYQLTGYPELDLIGQVDDLIRDDRIVLERPVTGPHVLASITSNEPVKLCWADGAEVADARADTAAASLNLTAIPAVLRKIASAAGDPYAVMLDGELLPSGELYLLDVLHVAVGAVEVITPADAYRVRRGWLDTAVQVLPEGTPVRVRAQARTRQAKTVLLEMLRDAGRDRVLARHLDHPYQPGRMSTGAAQLRFVRTADLVVHGIHWSGAGQPVFTLGAYTADRVPRTVATCVGHGNASFGAVTGDIALGSVVEVSYLHWTGRTLYQPEVLRIQHGTDPFDCMFDQFPDYTRETFAFPHPEQ